MSKRGKKAQLEISFGMIFSIILIIAFVAVAIYAIMAFLNWQKCAKVGMFKTELNSEVDRAWKSFGYSYDYSGTLPSDITYVCFGDLSSAKKGTFQQYYDEIKATSLSKTNMFFIPAKESCDGSRGLEIKNIDIKEITKTNNPYCFKNTNSKIAIHIEKDASGSLVMLK